MLWPPPLGELLIEVTVPGKAIPAGSKRGTAVRFKDSNGRWKVKVWRDKQGHEHAQVNVSDVNESKLKKRAKLVEEYAVAAIAESGFLLPEPKVPLAVEVVFVHPRPGTHYRTGRFDRILKADAPAFPVKAPDTTKIWRGFEDSLTGLLWHDDAYIAAQNVSEVLVPRWEEEETTLKLWRLPATVADLPPDDKGGLQAPSDEEQVSMLPSDS